MKFNFRRLTAAAIIAATSLAVPPAARGGQSGPASQHASAVGKPGPKLFDDLTPALTTPHGAYAHDKTPLFFPGNAGLPTTRFVSRSTMLGNAWNLSRIGLRLSNLSMESWGSYKAAASAAGGQFPGISDARQVWVISSTFTSPIWQRTHGFLNGTHVDVYDAQTGFLIHTTTSGKAVRRPAVYVPLPKR